MAHTPGPWRWELNVDHKEVQLVGGVPQFDLTVLDMVSWGMSGARIRLREDVDRMNIMRNCEDFAQPVPGREHHARWFQDIDHPDARLIAAAPRMLELLREFADDDCRDDEGDCRLCVAPLGKLHEDGCTLLRARALLDEIDGKEGT
jgi:hypothetical protein